MYLSKTVVVVSAGYAAFDELISTLRRLLYSPCLVVWVVKVGKGDVFWKDSILVRAELISEHRVFNRGCELARRRIHLIQTLVLVNAGEDSRKAAGSASHLGM